MDIKIKQIRFGSVSKPKTIVRQEFNPKDTMKTIYGIELPPNKRTPEPTNDTPVLAVLDDLTIGKCLELLEADSEFDLWSYVEARLIEKMKDKQCKN